MNTLKELEKLSLCYGGDKVNLSEYIRYYLDSDNIRILNMLESNPNGVEIKVFEELVDSFFEATDFCCDNFESEMMLYVKKDIGYFLEYLEKLNLSDEYNFSFMDAFFKKLSKYELDESRGVNLDIDILKLLNMRFNRKLFV